MDDLEELQINTSSREMDGVYQDITIYPIESQYGASAQIKIINDYGSETTAAATITLNKENLKIIHSYISKMLLGSS
jgi:hypothetical protein